MPSAHSCTYLVFARKGDNKITARGEKVRKTQDTVFKKKFLSVLLCTYSRIRPEPNKITALDNNRFQLKTAAPRQLGK